jgi:hypothetical protein
MKKLYPYPKNKRRFYYLQFVLVFGFIFTTNVQKVPNSPQKSWIVIANQPTIQIVPKNSIKPTEDRSLLLLNCSSFYISSI